MRTGVTLNLASTMTTTTTKTTFSPPATIIQRSPWHSPVPYLFGGLAAMLGLIAFALLILACSYWKLSGRRAAGEDQRDLEAGDEKPDNSAVKAFPTVFEEKIVVIMAGDVKPTFLATPMSSRASSFGDAAGKSLKKEEGKQFGTVEKPEQEMRDEEQNQENQESQ